MDETLQDVGSSPEPAAPAVADSSTAPLEASGESQGSVTATEGQQAERQTQVEDPLAGLPTIEELTQRAAQGLPGDVGMLNLRTAYEAQKAQYESLKPLEPWKSIAETIPDPSEVLADRELLRALYSPVTDPKTGQEIPDQYTTVPFLQQLETDSPGTVDRLFTDTLKFTVNGQDGQPSTVVRELVRSWGLDPDRIDDYRNIDQRAPQTGFVTPDQLAGIDPKFHDAFKALSPAQRDDILALKQEDGKYPSQVSDYLTDKAEAMETRQWKADDAKQKAEAQQREQAQYEQQTELAVNEDISGLRKSMVESIHQGLASQWKPTSDEGLNNLEYLKSIGPLAALLFPEISFIGENALKAAGITLDPKVAGIIDALAGARERVVRQTRAGDQRQAREAKSAANLAENQLKIKLGEYALALAKPSAERLQTQSQTLVNSLNGAAARIIPKGSTTAQPNGNGNPYDANPFPLGTPESRKWNMDMDRQMGLAGAQRF